MKDTITEASDCQLLSQLQGGEGAAFELLYRRHVGAIYALCWRLTANRTEAEELSQEVFFRAWKHRADFESGDHMRGWLRRVAVNLRRSALRKERLWGPTASLDADGPEPAAAREAPPGLQSELEQAIARLPDGARDVLVLHDIYGYKHAEIAQMLDIAVGTSRVQLHRARHKLQEVLS